MIDKVAFTAMDMDTTLAMQTTWKVYICISASEGPEEYGVQRVN